MKLEELSMAVKEEFGLEVSAPRIQVSDQGGTVIDGLDDISDDDYLRKVGTCLVVRTLPTTSFQAQVAGCFTEFLYIIIK